MISDLESPILRTTRNKSSKTFRMADFFCGAGGTSTGTLDALIRMGYEPEMTAVNHWEVAINTHTVNHPGVRHFCTNVDDLRPSRLYPKQRLHALWGSPSCRMHSQGNSGELDEQDRASAHCITRWAEAIGPDIILIENVPQFKYWGPINPRTKRPIAKRRGETFHAWLNMFRSLGYKVDYRELVCADYGDPTTRKRLFIQCVKGNRKITWPEATHAAPGQEENLFGRCRTWVSAEDIIDLHNQGESIFTREIPLCPNTISRIEHGIRKLGLDPFLVILRGTKKEQLKLTHRSLKLPLPTISAGGIHAAICEPVLYNELGEKTSLSIIPKSVWKNLSDLNGPPVFEVDGHRYTLDILYRMLNPKELALGQGFLPDYEFTGNQRDVLKQIGNAVPRKTARAIFAAAVSGNSRIHHNWS